jgi:hypothetical protein
MRCLRFDLQRKFSLYLNGELDTSAIKRVEDHLIDCGPCRTRLAHLRNGHRLALQMPRFVPRRDPWSAIEAALEARPTPAERPGTGWRALVFKPGFAVGVIGVAALIAALSIATNRRAPADEHATPLIAEALDLSEFQTVSIADIEQNQKPHVMTEGYVAEVRVDEQDGDLRFKLVDELGRPGPFIVCEIIDPIKLNAPPVGSRVRVYGVSRYDGQADHNWYEVHPVLNIEVVKR